jgi:hypothetical protein
VTRISAGLPINITQPGSQSVAGDLVTTSAVAQRPNIVGNPYAHKYKQFLNAAAFAVPAAGTFGNVHYDGVKGPLFNNWDAALQKNFNITEHVKGEFRAEMFDVPNHMSMFSINGTLGSPVGTGYQQNYNYSSNSYIAGTNQFGQVTSSTNATDPRTMEFVLRLNF